MGVYTQLSLDIPSLIPHLHIQLLMRGRFLNRTLCITLLPHITQASFSSREPRFLGTLQRRSFIVSLFWLLGRLYIILSQWIIYSEAFSKSEELLSASAELLGKFALCRTANTKRTKLKSVQLQQQSTFWGYTNS